jgi:hypothetical protein
MLAPLLYLQIFEQLSQWIKPQDKRHLQGFAEIVAAILQSQSACLSHWLPYLSHRDCQARSHLERLSYFVHNPKITAETFYAPLIKHFLSVWSGEALELTLDTSMLWDQFCLIEVCLIWGGRSIPLAQTVLEHGSATVGFEQYRPVLETVAVVLPDNCTVTLLADRGFEHGSLMRWLRQRGWSWCIRAKCDLQVTLTTGKPESVAQLLPEPGQANLFHHVRILEDISCHLATANLPTADEPWAVITDSPPSLQTFACYGRRFGGIEPHFKDYKSAGFELIRSHLRDAQALTCVLMLLATAQLFALHLGFLLTQLGQRYQIDWHGDRGLSFLQLGLRQLQRLCYQGLPIPPLRPLPRSNPPPACASRRKREILACQIEFSRVTVFSS